MCKRNQYLDDKVHRQRENAIRQERKFNHARIEVKTRGAVDLVVSAAPWSVTAYTHECLLEKKPKDFNKSISAPSRTKALLTSHTHMSQSQSIDPYPRTRISLYQIPRSATNKPDAQLSQVKLKISPAVHRMALQSARTRDFRRIIYVHSMTREF